MMLHSAFLVGGGRMKVGCVKEIKKHEYRVGMTPHCAQSYIAHGHQVVIQAGAGADAGFEYAEYESAGGRIEADRKKIYAGSDMIIKVKEPQPEEYQLL